MIYQVQSINPLCGPNVLSEAKNKAKALAQFRLYCRIRHASWSGIVVDENGKIIAEQNRQAALDMGRKFAAEDASKEEEARKRLASMY